LGKTRILNPGSLRGRLSLAYAVALILALVTFAAVALTAVDRAQRVALDSQLESTAGALRIIGDADDGTLTVDAKDRVQFASIVGSKQDAAVVAAAGDVLVSTDPRIARILAHVALGREGASDIDAGPLAGELRVFAEPIFLGGKRLGGAVTWSDIAAIAALDRNVALAFAFAIPLIAIVALLAGGEIARRGLAPLDRIANLASEIEARDLSRRLALPARTDELGRLSATFDRMLDRLQHAFDRERRFTSDASHELRAPLAVIRAEADLALRVERSPAEYQRALETIATEADALEQLTRDLLAAARGPDESEDVRTPVDLSVVAQTVAQRVGVIAGARRVRVALPAGGSAVVEGNRVLIERAVLSVLHNALKYSPEAGSVEIRVGGERPHAELTVRDDGPGFSPAALERAFDRFWRDDEARTREGSGLGLSLARTIVERYGGTIALSNVEPHGAFVRMTFPVGNPGA
jgi:signal transduction histidine kinase